MGEKTKLKLTQFNDRNESRFELLYGDFVALFRRVGEHEIKLPHGDIKLHGTTFFIQSPKDGTSDQICLMEGKIDVTADPIAPKPTAVPTPPNLQVLHAGLASASTPIPAMISAAPTATPSPVLPGTAQLVATGDPKMCEISQGTVEVNPNLKIVELHPQSEIRELESLYELP